VSTTRVVGIKELLRVFLAKRWWVKREEEEIASSAGTKFLYPQPLTLNFALSDHTPLDGACVIPRTRVIFLPLRRATRPFPSAKDITVALKP
jgi:hypothetical protein